MCRYEEAKYNDKLNDMTTDVLIAVNTLKSVAESQSTIVYVQSFVTAASFYLVMSKECGYSRSTLSKQAARFKDIASALKAKLRGGILRTSKTVTIGGGPCTYVKVKDVNHDVTLLDKMEQAATNPTPEQCIEMACDYVVTQSHIQEAIDRWDGYY